MFDKILKIMEEQLGIDVAGITEETTFREDLRIDSLDLYELVTALEDEYGIEIPDDVAENFTKVSDIVKYVEANK